jgi:hypothetical protein
MNDLIKANLANMRLHACLTIAIESLKNVEKCESIEEAIHMTKDIIMYIDYKLEEK